jgi:hypothetical protein
MLLILVHVAAVVDGGVIVGIDDNGSGHPHSRKNYWNWKEQEWTRQRRSTFTLFAPFRVAFQDAPCTYHTQTNVSLRSTF